MAAKTCCLNAVLVGNGLAGSSLTEDRALRPEEPRKLDSCDITRVSGVGIRVIILQFECWCFGTRPLQQRHERMAPWLRVAYYLWSVWHGVHDVRGHEIIYSWVLKFVVSVCKWFDLNPTGVFID
jgi:hypothetical protein